MVSRDAPNATAARCPNRSAGTSPAHPRPTPPGPTPSFATPPRRTTARRSYPLRPAAVASTLVALLSSTQRTSPSVTATRVMRCGGGASDDTPAASASTVNRSGAAACAKRSAAPAFSALCAPTAVRGRDPPRRPRRDRRGEGASSPSSRRGPRRRREARRAEPNRPDLRRVRPSRRVRDDPLPRARQHLSADDVPIRSRVRGSPVGAAGSTGPVAAPPRGSAANEPSPRTHANALAFAAAYASTLPWRST